MKIPADLMIRERNGDRIEKRILRKALEDTRHLPEEILWRYKVQYTQGPGCESLGEKMAERELTDDEYERIRAENSEAVINRKEGANSRYSGSFIPRTPFWARSAFGRALTLPKKGTRQGNDGRRPEASLQGCEKAGVRIAR